jgi:hypothetical protein
MHGSHDHSHEARPLPPVSAGVSLLRMSAFGRIGVATALAVVLWLLVFAVTR